MLNNRPWLLGALTVLTAATTIGCGQTALTNATTGATKSAASLAAVSVQGVTRKLGYNADRYQRVLSRQAKPVHLPRRAKLPATVDNRQWCPPVYDQGQLGSCTAFAMGKGLREYMQRKNGEKQVSLSALDLYYYERVNMGKEYINQDSGANMIDGMTVLENRGAASDESWPYKISFFKQQPPAAADASAAEWKIKKSTNLANLDDIKTAIADGKSVAFGFMVYRNFMRIGANGVMPMPSGNPIGGHAVLAVGYDDAKEMLIVRNSWGAGFGDKGYFYMPYAFAKDSEQAMEWYTAD
ncbi:Papain family cysteine protease [compost metagenome]